MDDRELLRDYVGNCSQDAFRQLVERHLPMVYSAAQRMVRDSHLAEEVAQNVFTTLALKANSIRPPQVVGGWLYNTAHHLALHAVRTEQRRREREQTAFAMQTLDLASDNSGIAEHLEPAMSELNAEDRDALVLRYLENRSLREVGAEMGISEDAARMRVNRALERLRARLEHQGVAVTTVLLATAITSCTAAAPAGLGTTIATTALAAVTTATLTQATVINMNWFNAKAAAAILSAAVIAGTGTYFGLHKQITRAKAGLRTSAAQQEQLTVARDEALSTIQVRDQEVERLRKEVTELPRLRGEVTRLRADIQERTGLKTATAQQTNKLRIVAGILITNAGPPVVSEEQIRAHIHIKVGDVYSRADIDRDVRSLYGTGMFTNVRVSEEIANEAAVLTYVVQGKPQPAEPGKYIPKAQLSFAGSATPEAALQSITWLILYGDYDDHNAAALAPEMRDNRTKDPKNREVFVATQEILEPVFKGMQILARKAISDDRVELKIRMDFDPLPSEPSGSGIATQPMVKVGNEWKLGGSSHEYRADWDQSGTIQTFTR